MTKYWNDTFDERLEDAYARDLAILAGRINVTRRVSAAELESLPQTQYVKAVAEYGSPESGFGVAILATDVPPLSTESVARELRVLVEALPNHEFEGVLRRQAPARHGGAFSWISASGRSVGF